MTDFNQARMGQDPHDLLPVVTEEIFASFQASIKEEGVYAVMMFAKEQFMANNYLLYMQVGEMVMRTLGPNPDKNALVAAQVAQSITYELLRRQADANGLNLMLGPPEA